MDEARGGPLAVAGLRVVAFDVAVDCNGIVSEIGGFNLQPGGVGLPTIAHFEANVVPVEGSWGRREHGVGVEWMLWKVKVKVKVD